MNIAYIIYPDVMIAGPANGIRGQAMAWRKGLIDAGHNVNLICPWGEAQKWSQYDVIHFFGGTSWFDFIDEMKKYNPNVLFSPVFDSIESVFKLNLLAHLSFKGYHHPWSLYRKRVNCFRGILVRSEYERRYFKNAFYVPAEKIYKVPLSLTLDDSFHVNPVREKICFHVSLLSNQRKNVRRLIEAAKKYGFPLVLAGDRGISRDFSPILNAIGQAQNIRLLGFLTKTELLNYYARAKVFALPSINEGVGLVALDAAALGCEVVITDKGGPKEYYQGDKLAWLVNPYSVDSIGQAICSALTDTPRQPMLRQHVLTNFSTHAITSRLLEVYKEILNSSINIK